MKLYTNEVDGKYLSYSRNLIFLCIVLVAHLLLYFSNIYNIKLGNDLNQIYIHIYCFFFTLYELVKFQVINIHALIS